MDSPSWNTMGSKRFPPGSNVSEASLCYFPSAEQARSILIPTVAFLSRNSEWT